MFLMETIIIFLQTYPKIMKLEKKPHHKVHLSEIEREQGKDGKEKTIN